jgi:hypothetical protein
MARRRIPVEVLGGGRREVLWHEHKNATRFGAPPKDIAASRV